MNDSITIAADSLQVLHATQQIRHTSYSWIWIVIGVLVFLLIVILWTRHKLRDYRNMRRKVMGTGDIDFSNTMNDIFQSRQIYDQLKVAYHPDRFIDPEKNDLANQLYQDLLGGIRNLCDNVSRLSVDCKRSVKLN